MSKRIQELEKPQKESHNAADPIDVDQRVRAFNTATEIMIQALENRDNHLDAYMSHMKAEFDSYINKKSTK